MRRVVFPGVWEIFDSRCVDRVLVTVPLAEPETAIRRAVAVFPFADYERVGKHRSYTLADAEGES
jgi:hypothetical protein